LYKKINVLSYLLLFVFLLSVSGVRAGIVTTKHNFSKFGPGTVKSTEEERVCVFCHTPHLAITRIDGVNVPLWNHTLSNESYQLYTSPTLLSSTSPFIQPDGSSRLCLSCHDGTVALGSVVNTGTALNTISIQGAGAGGMMPSSSSLIDVNMSGHHPVSIEVSGSLIIDKNTQCNENIVSYKVCRPSVSSPVKLDRTNNMYGGSRTGVGVQCSSCHDPHNDPDPGNSVFLRVGNRNDTDQLCSECHRECSFACP
jgi:hypothetical protein